MNTKKHFLTAAATTAIVGLASVAPAQAASFGTGGISFDKDTTVEFELNQSYGIYKSFLNVYEVQGDGSLLDLGSLFKETKAYDSADVIDTGAIKGPVVGTCDNAIVCDDDTTFTFEAGKEYTLGMLNYGRWQDPTRAGVTPRYDSVYSTTSLNDSGQQAVFGSWGGTELNGFDSSLFQEVDIFDGWKKFSFDDGGNNSDKDFQDFQLMAKAVSTPEPTVLFGLGVVASGMFMTRRKKNKAS